MPTFFSVTRLSHIPTLLLLLAGCASDAPVTPAAPQPIIVPAPAVCPAPEPAPACPEPPLVPEPPVVQEEPRGKLLPADWSMLPDWQEDNQTLALQTFIKGCAVLDAQAPWQKACARARATPQNQLAAFAFFMAEFNVFRVVGAVDDSPIGLLTGYYEPLLLGSRTKTSRYRYPIYATPQDLLTIDLSDVYPDLKHRRLRGRIEGGKVVPYFDRAEIEGGKKPLTGLEIAWVDNAVDLFFLQIQGSGQIQLESGERLRVGYADQNGHPFRSLGGALIRRGEMKLANASMQGIKEWARKHPRRVQSFMNLNPSYVFFRELSGNLSGPLGTLGVPLTPERSIAADQRIIPLGAPVFIATTLPNSTKPLNRLMVAQDTGGAIAGAVRADFYWGFGDAAGQQAGRMKQQLNMWLLLPKAFNLADLPPTVQVQK